MAPLLAEAKAAEKAMEKGISAEEAAAEAAVVAAVSAGVCTRSARALTRGGWWFCIGKAAIKEQPVAEMEAAEAAVAAATRVQASVRARQCGGTKPQVWWSRGAAPSKRLY